MNPGYRPDLDLGDGEHSSLVDRMDETETY